MISKIITAARPGFHSTLITVEADILTGLPGLTIVGLPDHAVRESRDRIRSAITNSGYIFPARQIVVNLSPNDTPKEGALLEAAMAVAILVASGQLPQEAFETTAIVGALSLDGSLSPGRGLTATAIFAGSESRVTRLIVPASQANSIQLPPDKGVFPLQSLADLRDFAARVARPLSGKKFQPQSATVDISMEHIFGLHAAKRALAIAATGRLHVLLIGSAGTGKSLLARAYQHILPPLSYAEAVEITRLYSLAGIGDGEITRIRPFRAPHHTASTAALVGGGVYARPGEISLAHHGTLFLDELTEFRADTLQSLREPLEDRHISISRARGSLTYPADFQLIAAANPCRCGNLMNPERQCSCPPKTVDTHFTRIIGPFLDRIAIELNLDTLEDAPTAVNNPLTTNDWKERIAHGRINSRLRNGGKLNADLTPAELYNFLKVVEPENLFNRLRASQNISMRSWLHVLRVALSVSDLDGIPVDAWCVQQALAYRAVTRWLGNRQQRAA
jgi:magnesium chelatase family protein